MGPEVNPSANQEDDKHYDNERLTKETISSSGSLKKPYIVENGFLDKAEALDQSQQWSMVSVSPRSGGLNMFESSPMMNPPSVQTITSPYGYDPDRIPSSIFSSKPTTPTDCWSVASNDSLFSIQMGNNSFTRDYSFKPEDWCNSPLRLNSISELESNDDCNSNNNNNINFTSNLPRVSEAVSEGDTKNVDNNISLADNDTDQNAASGGHNNNHLSVTSSNLSDGKRLSMNPPRGSNGSAESCRSFAFPLLVENGRSGRSYSPKTMPVTPLNKEEESPLNKEEEPPLHETQNQELEPTCKCKWFSRRICWPGCCFKLC